jgi:hypothetical protein
LLRGVHIERIALNGVTETIRSYVAQRSVLPRVSDRKNNSSVLADQNILFDILGWRWRCFWLDRLTRVSRAPRLGRHISPIFARRVVGDLISRYARLAARNFDKPRRIQEETAESEWSSVKSIAVPAPISVHRCEVRIIKSQAGDILKTCPIESGICVESGICAIAATIYATRGSRPRDRSANAGAALRARTNGDVCGS